ncbi:hypothetical protein DFP72DRAFT_899778 [Ephemerocybe angulata]|uniref:Uncharacterized protein n=1 Tax=Ephemerocybe angulata TaxID=980116 RepID=A0A8H6HXR0_9AGAR|nr:hypothetical protein DFP72DRAFT_899778 [Tulosesus angulatus]
MEALPMYCYRDPRSINFVRAAPAPAESPARPPGAFRGAAQVFRTQELLALICQEILPGDPTSLSRARVLEGRKRLRDLALTCSTTKEAALNSLWSYLDCLLPLVKVLPNVQLIGNTYHFRGTSLPPDAAFRSYASRLRILGVPLGSDVGLRAAEKVIAPQVYVVLARIAAGDHFFPGLRTIFFGSRLLDPTVHTAALPILISPVLEKITFFGKGVSRPIFASYSLPLLAEQSRDTLKHLTIETPTGEPVAQDIFAPILLLEELETLDLRFPEATGIEPRSLLDILGALPSLRILTLDVHFPQHQVPNRYFSQNASQLGLRIGGLQSVHLFSRCQKICGCLPGCLLERMTHLTMIVNESMLEDGGERFNHNRGVLSRASNLRKLDLVVNGTVGETRDLTLLAGTVEEYSVDATAIEDPDAHNCITGKLVHNRPALKSLSLSSRSRSGGYQGIPLTCIQHIANDGREINHLALEFLPLLCPNQIGEPRSIVADILRGWLRQLRSTNYKSRSKLRTLAIRERTYDSFSRASLSVEQGNALAQILDILFPSLESIRPFVDSEATYWYWSGRWLEIETLRKTYKALRLAQTSSSR